MMKHLKKLILMTLLLGLMGCNEKIPGNESESEINDEIELEQPEHMRSPASNDSMDSRSDHATGMMTPDARKAMYAEVGMSQQQIADFEKWAKDTTNVGDPTAMQAARDAKLRQMLQNDQYVKYEKWRDRNTHHTGH